MVDEYKVRSIYRTPVLQVEDSIFVHPFGDPDPGLGAVPDNPYRQPGVNPYSRQADLVNGYNRLEDVLKFHMFKAFLQWRQIAYEMAWFDKDVWQPWSGLQERQLSWRFATLPHVEQSHSSSSMTQLPNKKSKVEESVEQEVCPCLMCRIGRCVWSPE